MNINREYNMVKDFHKAFNHPHSEKPTPMPLQRAEKRYAWMKEEIDEFIEASEKQNMYDQADAMIDVIYFALGTLVEMGIEPAPLFEIVQQANMSKLWEDGKPHFNEMGKVIKPSNWVDPYPLLKEEIDRQDK